MLGGISIGMFFLTQVSMYFNIYIFSNIQVSYIVCYDDNHNLNIWCEFCFRHGIKEVRQWYIVSI